jgi:hypothetical protein
MNSTGPWWSTPAFTLGGVLLTLLVTVWLDHRRGRRESRHRWTERKMELYSEFLDACDVVRDIRVWPVGRDADPAPTAEPFSRVKQASRRSAYVAPAAVRDRLTLVVRAANRLVTTIEEVRAESTRGHSGGVDDRLRAGLIAASEEFDEAVDAFVTASRTDIDVVERVS